jgi:phosphoribosylformylglycinamidine synthase
MVRTNTSNLPGLGAGVVRIKGTDRALAMSVDGNGRYCYLDPYRGAMLAVAEAARNVACAGATPIGATNNLNFGNPQRPEIMWQFAQAVAGLGEACRAFEIPITGGNVSLYNETEGRAILPTPVIGIVGLFDDASRVVGRVFPRSDAAIVLIGENRGELGGSEFLKTIGGLVRGLPPAIDLAREKAVQRLLPALVRDRLVLSAHDVSDGGLAVTLAECCFDSGGRGADVDLPGVVEAGPFSATLATLFGESAPQVIVSAADEHVDELLARAQAEGLPARVIGRTGGTTLRVRIDGHEALSVAVAEAEAVWSSAIEQQLQRQDASAA